MKADGTVIREYRNGLEVTSPAGTRTWYPQQRMLAAAQAGTPPELPADPMKGRRWLELHSAALRSLISDLVGGSAAEMQGLEAAEARDLRGDLFRQIEYRAEIASFFAARRQAR